MNVNDKQIIANILIVDDKPENIYSLETLLWQENMPVQFLHATSGNEALKIAYRGNIALILLDVQMPEMDGYEVATILKQVKSCQNIPIIFVTALNHEAKYVTEGYSKGAVDYLFKPLDPIITRCKVSSFINLYLQQKKLENAYNDLELIVQKRTADLKKKNAALNQEIERRTSAEIELKSKNDTLIKLNQNLDQFVYTASHDLKLPVANMEALVTALKEELDGTISEESKQLLHMLDDSILQLRSTIHDLIETIRKEHEGSGIEPIDCKKVLEEVKLSVAELIKNSQATILEDFTGCEEFQFNRVAFKSILYNLITNSIKYKHPDRPPVVNIVFENKFGDFVLSVKDNGNGMTEEERHKLFQIFERLDNNHSEGTGIGLFMVKNMIEKYGVSLEVRSEKNVGTEFIFHFSKAEIPA